MAAKTLTGNPIVVIGGGTDTFTTTQDRVKIHGFYWETGANAAVADTVKITHGDGTSIIWESTLIVGNLGDHSLMFNKALQANGLVITPPTHGTLFVYLADSYV
jgi:hypothetical protein